VPLVSVAKIGAHPGGSIITNRTANADKNNSNSNIVASYILKNTFSR
jgi:hypothetical protein